MNLAEKLVEHFGGRKPAAESLGVSGETIRLWLRDGIPLERAIDVERDTSGAVTAEQVLQAAKDREQQAAA